MEVSSPRHTDEKHCKNAKLSDTITPYHLVEGSVYNEDILQNRVYFLKKSFRSILQGVAQSKYNFIADSLEELRLLFQGWWEAAVFGSFHHLHMEKILLLESLKVKIYFPEPRLPAVRNRDFQHWWHVRTRICILSSST